MWRLLGFFSLFFLLFPLVVHGEALTIGNYVLESSTRVSRFDYEYVYKASVTNSGEDVVDVSASLVSGSPYITVVEGVLSFGNVASGTAIQSVDTFMVKHNRLGPFDENALVWNITSQPAVSLRANFNSSPPTGNAPLSVTFSPDIITTSAIEYYEWDLNGDGYFERRDTVGRNQSYYYSSPGDYYPALRIRDSRGNQDTQTLLLSIVNAPPIVTAQAQPSNGQVPLSVSFTVTASDNEGIASYEWDFEGDGVYDYSSASSGNVSHVYSAEGVFDPKLRVTDNLGVAALHSVPTTEVTAAPTGSPSVILYGNNVSQVSGNAPLQVVLSGSATDPQQLPFVQWEWDFDGDGSYDQATSTSSTSFSYSTAGVYFPRVRVQTSDGRSAEDTIEVLVKQNVSLSVSTDTIDPSLSETTTVTTSLSAATKAQINIEDKNGSLVRTLVPLVERGAGTYSDVWDGMDDSGAVVAEGEYRAVLLYEFNGKLERYDLGLTTGGAQYNPSRSRIVSSFSPFANTPMIVDIYLSRASEVDAFIGRFYTNTRLVTLLQRVPLGKGTHRITWNGENGEGELIQPPPGDMFLFGLWGYTLPNNAIYVRSGAHIAGLTVSPSIFDPTSAPGCDQANLSISSFSLSQPATIELVVTDVDAGTEVARFQYPGLAAGSASIAWDGKTNDGTLVAPGRYRLGLAAIDANGYKSLSVYVLQRVYY